jgi:lipopolysaccharide export system protein LptA
MKLNNTKQYLKQSIFIKILGGLIILGSFISAANAQVSSFKDHDLMNKVKIAADDFKAQQKRNAVSYIGNVKVTQGNLSFSSHELTAIFKNKTIDTLKAKGNVKLTSPTETIESRWCLYDLTAKIITLGGGITLTTKNGVVRGDKLILDLKSGLMKIEGSLNDKGQKRVTGEFKPAQ